MTGTRSLDSKKNLSKTHQIKMRIRIARNDQYAVIKGRSLPQLDDIVFTNPAHALKIQEELIAHIFSVIGASRERHANFLDVLKLSMTYYDSFIRLYHLQPVDTYKDIVEAFMSNQKFKKLIYLRPTTEEAKQIIFLEKGIPFDLETFWDKCASYDVIFTNSGRAKLTNTKEEILLSSSRIMRANNDSLVFTTNMTPARYKRLKFVAFEPPRYMPPITSKYATYDEQNNCFEGQHYPQMVSKMNEPNYYSNSNFVDAGLQEQYLAQYQKPVIHTNNHMNQHGRGSDLYEWGTAQQFYPQNSNGNIQTQFAGNQASSQAEMVYTQNPNGRIQDQFAMNPQFPQAEMFHPYNPKAKGSHQDRFAMNQQTVPQAEMFYPYNPQGSHQDRFAMNQQTVPQAEMFYPYNPQGSHQGRFAMDQQPQAEMFYPYNPQGSHQDQFAMDQQPQAEMFYPYNPQGSHQDQFAMDQQPQTKMFYPYSPQDSYQDQFAMNQRTVPQTKMFYPYNPQGSHQDRFAMNQQTVPQAKMFYPKNLNNIHQNRFVENQDIFSQTEIGHTHNSNRWIENQLISDPMFRPEMIYNQNPSDQFAINPQHFPQSEIIHTQNTNGTIQNQLDISPQSFSLDEIFYPDTLIENQVTFYPENYPENGKEMSLGESADQSNCSTVNDQALMSTHNQENSQTYTNSKFLLFPRPQQLQNDFIPQREANKRDVNILGFTKN